MSTPYAERYVVNQYGCSCSDVTCPATSVCVAYTCSYGVCEPGTAPQGTVCGADKKCTANGQCWPVCAVQPGCAVSQPVHTSEIADHWCPPSGTFASNTCWGCASGYTWDTATSTCKLTGTTCQTPCTSGLLYPRCSSDSASLLTCTDNCQTSTTCTNGCTGNPGSAICSGGVLCTQGETRCNGNVLETCTPGGLGGLYWNPTQTCPAGCSGPQGSASCNPVPCGTPGTSSWYATYTGSYPTGAIQTIAYPPPQGMSCWVCNAATGYSYCSPAICKLLQSDPNNCGSCSNVCSPSTPNCVAGNCQATPCTETCANRGFSCGTQTICGAQVNCGSCEDNNACTQDTCNAQGQCAYTNVAGVCTIGDAQGICSQGTCIAACTNECTIGEKGCIDESTTYACHAPDATHLCRYKAPATTCVAPQYCDAGACALATITASPAAQTLIAGSLLTITVNKGVLVVLASTWPSGGGASTTTYSYTTTKTDVGEHNVLLKAYSATAILLGTASASVTVHCDPAEPTYGPCCAGLTWKKNGETCTMSDQTTGICNDQGACTKYCAPHNSTRCGPDKNIYNVDGCGQLEDIAENCVNAGKECQKQGNTYLCSAMAPICNNTYVYRCEGQTKTREDTSCGITTNLGTCNDDERCEATSTGARCVAKSQCDNDPNRPDLCGTRCVNLQSSWSDCGACDAQCARSEQCVRGDCTQIPGCNVVCASNDDCGEGEICANAGDCWKSECQRINLIALNETAIQSLAEELTTSGLLTLATRIDGTRILFTLTNLGPTPAKNVTITTTFAKIITPYASTLTVKDVAYDILEDDPVLRFSIPEVGTEKRFTVIADHVLDPSYIYYLQHVIAAGEQGDIASAVNKTKEALQIGINSDYDGKDTNFHVTLNPTMQLGGVSVPLQIPKCLAQKASELTLNGNYKIVQDDPLIVWQFDELEKPAEITFSIPKDVDEECKAQLRAMAYAQRFGKPVNPWLALLLIPAIGGTLLFFQRFTPTQKLEKLSRKEFDEIAAAQGLSKDDVERQWAEYRRRF